MKLFFHSSAIDWFKMTIGFCTILLSNSYVNYSHAEKRKMSVQVTRVKALEVAAKIKVAATVHSLNNVALSANVEGELSWVVEPGAVVKQGETLVQLDSKLLLLEKLQQQAVIERSQNRLAYLQREYQRIESLQKNNSVSVDELEKIQSEYVLAQGDLAVADAQLARIVERIERTRIDAPFAGTVITRNYRAGEVVNRGDLIVRLVDTENLELRAFVPIRYFSQLSVGDTLQFHDNSHFLTANRQSFEGSVRVKIPHTDTQSQTFEVRVDIAPAAAQAITVGQLVDLSLSLHSAPAGIAVPRDALLLRQNGSYVVLVDTHERARLAQVNVGNGAGEWVEVSGQLNTGDRVVVRGAERLQDGESVTIQPRPSLE